MTKHLADWIKTHPDEARRLEERFARENSLKPSHRPKFGISRKLEKKYRSDARKEITAYEERLKHEQSSSPGPDRRQRRRKSF
jgi:hypothetical protein